MKLQNEKIRTAPNSWKILLNLVIFSSACYALPLHLEFQRTRYRPWWLWSHQERNRPSHLAPSMPSSNRTVSIDRYAFARARRKGMGLDLHLLAMPVACPFSIRLKRFLDEWYTEKKTKDTFAFLCYQKLILIISLIQYVLSPIASLCQKK